MKIIKILYVVSSLKKCAPTQQLYNIVKHLDNNLFECHILTLSPEPEKTQHNDFKNLNIKIDSLNLNRLQFVIFGLTRLREYLLNIKPDIIHTSGIRADYSISKLNLPISHCLSIRNYAYEDFGLRYGKIIGLIAAKFHIQIMKKSNYPVFCSNALKYRYQHILSNQLYAVQDGIDTDVFKQIEDNESKKKLRRKLKLPEDKYIFIVSGHLSTIKDPITVLKAFLMINKKTAHLIYIGKGHLMNILKNNSPSNVSIIGYVDNVEDYLNASDCFISASISEGMGNSVIEAAACGLDLLLSDIPSHREICNSYADDHTFFKIKNSEQLYQLMKLKIQSNSKDKSDDFKQFIIKNFSAFHMSHNYQKLYSQMMKKDINPI